MRQDFKVYFRLHVRRLMLFRKKSSASHSFWGESCLTVLRSILFLDIDGQIDKRFLLDGI